MASKLSLTRLLHALARLDLSFLPSPPSILVFSVAPLVGQVKGLEISIGSKVSLARASRAQSKSNNDVSWTQ
mgnify:CR=1 FL=1